MIMRWDFCGRWNFPDNVGQDTPKVLRDELAVMDRSLAIRY